MQDRLSAALDARDFFEGLFDGWDGQSNVKCPFAASRHGKGDDRNPSMTLYEEDGHAHCHACGWHGGATALYAGAKGVDETRAKRVLWSRYVEPLVPDEEWRGPARKLMVNPVALKRLLDFRGLTRPTAIKYHLGYDGRRLTIPVFNEEGYCVNIRRYDLFKDGGPKMVSWKKGFGKARLYPDIPASGDVYLVEGELDALIGRQVGLNTVTPSGGAQTWRPDWNYSFKGRSVFVVPDMDEAGVEGGKKRCRMIAQLALSVAMVELPKMPDGGKDLTDWLVRNGGTADGLRALALAAGGATTEGAQGSSQNGKSAQSKTSAPSIAQGTLNLEAAKDEGKLVDRAQQVWAHLNSDGRFFRNSEGELFYVQTDKDPVRVTDAPGPFMALLTRLSPLINQATITGKFIFKFLQNNTFAWGELSRTGVWTLYDRGVGLFVHAGGASLLKIKDGKHEIIKNAVNGDHVLLDTPTKGISICELPNSMPADGLKSLRRFFLDVMPMSEEDRYFLLCWLVGIFLRDHIGPKPLVRLLASTASGKSTVSKLLSVLVYGEELLSHSASTMAATYELANRFPLLLLDNLETGNMTPEITDFLLIAATGGMRVKRRTSSDRGVIMERTNCLVLTNGIEPFNRHELIDRTVELPLDIARHGQAGFHESAVFAGLRENRQKIMGALLFLLSKYVLPRLEKGDLKKVLVQFGPHGKERFNEYLALMALILDALWGYMPLEAYRRPHDLVSYWLDSQTKALTAQDVGTDDVLYYLNTLQDKHLQLVGSSLIFTAGTSGTTLVCTTRELLTDFRVLARFLGTRCPWQNERQLGTRLADSEVTLRKAGWERERRRVHGRDEYIYRRKNERTGDKQRLGKTTA